MGVQDDPLAGLKAELAEEAAAAEAEQNAGGKSAKAATSEAEAEEPGEGDEVEAGTEEEAGAGAEEGEAEAGAEEQIDEEKAAAAEAAKATKAAKDKPAKGKGRETMVPVARANEEAAKRRVAERQLAEAQAELAKLKGPEEGKAAAPAKTEEQIREEAKQQARMEIQIESFLDSAYGSYGKKEFDDLSANIVEIAGPEVGAERWLVPLALEATGSPEAAAKAIWALGQQESETIEALLKLRPLRLAARLVQLSTARIKPTAAEGDDETAPKPKLNGKKVSTAPEPIKPVRGSAQATEEFSDSMTDADFDVLFNKRILHKGSAAQN